MRELQFALRLHLLVRHCQQSYPRESFGTPSFSLSPFADAKKNECNRLAPRAVPDNPDRRLEFENVV